MAKTILSKKMIASIVAGTVLLATVGIAGGVLMVQELGNPPADSAQSSSSQSGSSNISGSSQPESSSKASSSSAASSAVSSSSSSSKPGSSSAATISITNTVSLVNQKCSLSSDFVPADMTDIASRVSSTKAEIYMVDEAALAFIKMVNAMKAAGVTDVVAVSGYRSYNYQKNIFEARIASNQTTMAYKEAWAAAASIIAPPGTSEHQTGLAIDLSTKSKNYALDSDFADTPAGKWLGAHCQDFGFILRYREDKQDITKIVYEPWHFRYVGKPHADIIMGQSLCLEEYLAMLKDKGALTLPVSQEEKYVVSAMAQPDYFIEGLSQISKDGMGGYISTALIKSKTE